MALRDVPIPATEERRGEMILFPKGNPSCSARYRNHIKFTLTADDDDDDDGGDSVICDYFNGPQV